MATIRNNGNVSVFNTKSRRIYVPSTPKKYVNLRNIIEECLHSAEFDDYFALKNLKHDDNLIGFKHQMWAMNIIFHYKLLKRHEEKKILAMFTDRFENYILKLNPDLKKGHSQVNDTPG